MGGAIMARRKVKVDIRDLIGAFQMNMLESDQFLDTVTGEITLLTDDARRAAEEFFDEVELGKEDDTQVKLDGWLETADIIAGRKMMSGTQF